MRVVGYRLDTAPSQFIMWIYKALSSSPIMDCYCIGAVITQRIGAQGFFFVSALGGTRVREIRASAVEVCGFRG